MGNEDKELVELIVRVKRGDPDSYKELVSRYRLAAVSWARDIVRDDHLAEDVAQEALLRIVTRLHQLQDERKFTGWFRLIVRRLSINYIRGAYRDRELTVDSLPDTGHPISEEAGPDSWQKREEQEEEIHSSLQSLPARSRAVLMSSAYSEATPEELAVRFNMNKSNVYNVLSRARTKANDERFEKEISHYLNERRSRRKSVSITLSPPVLSRPYAFLSIMVGEVLRSIGSHPFSPTELLGISGEAFRLNVPPGCHWRGIATFDWSYTAYRTMERLGIAGSCCGRPQTKTMTPEHQVQMLSVIQQSLEAGIPAIVRNMQLNEFGFIYGFDDESREIRYCGFNRSEGCCRYEQLGRMSEDQPLFIMGIRGKTASPLNDDAILRAIIQHARGREPHLAGFVFGLDGYRLWLEAIEEGTLDLSGHAYQVAIMSEARQQAANYLYQLADKYNTASKRQLLAAADCYNETAQSFFRLYPRFPFGYGGSHGNRMDMIRNGLREAWEAEAQGVDHLDSIIKEG